MSNELSLPVSPFDAAMLPGELWSARALMDLLGYPRWQEFTPAINRAMASAEAQGHDRHELFRVNPEKTAGRPREDFLLSRFACYLVAMNGDPRKREVAEAQAYFAIKTREAEVAPQAAAAALPDRKALARMVIEAEEARELAEAELAASRPLIERAKNHASGSGLKTRQQFFREIKQWVHDEHGVEIKQAQVVTFLSTAKLGIFVRGNRSDSGQATAWAIEHGYARNIEDTALNGHNYVTGKLTPRGQEYAWERIVRFIDANGHLDLPRQIGGAA